MIKMGITYILKEPKKPEKRLYIPQNPKKQESQTDQKPKIAFFDQIFKRQLLPIERSNESPDGTQYTSKYTLYFTFPTTITNKDGTKKIIKDKPSGLPVIKKGEISYNRFHRAKERFGNKLFKVIEDSDIALILNEEIPNTVFT